MPVNRGAEVVGNCQSSRNPGGGTEGAAAWLTVTVLPATRTVVVRLASRVAGHGHRGRARPEPLPLTDAHDEPDDEVHVHPAVVVTDTAAVAEPDWKVNDAGDTV